MKKQNFQDIEKLISAARIPYRVILTNYTARIESDFLQHKDIGEDRGKRFFAAAAKVKSDVKKVPVPEVDIHKVNFFRSNIHGEMYAENIYGVDIKSAYATALLNSGMITKETFEYISKIPKQDRLGAIGMLASNKKIFDIDANGEIINAEEQTSETAPFFYYACKCVEDIMNTLRECIPLKDFYFTWVDCIYLRTEKSARICEQILSQNGYNFNPSFYSSMLVQKKKKHYKITLIEPQENEEKVKVFTLPLPEEKTKKDLENFILSKQTKKYV